LAKLVTCSQWKIVIQTVKNCPSVSKVNKLKLSLIILTNNSISFRKSLETTSIFQGIN